MSLPDPLVPSYVDLTDFKFMPLEVARLFDSEIMALKNAEAFRAGVASWCKGWHQVPAASLPNDDAALCKMLGYGRDLEDWAEIRNAGALRGWVLCSDGRLYHSIVAEKALEAWLEKLAQRLSSGAGNAKRWGIDFDPRQINEQIATAREYLARLNPQSKALTKRKPPAIPAGIPDGWAPEVQSDDNRQSRRDNDRDSRQDRKGQGQRSESNNVVVGSAASAATTTTGGDLIEAFEEALVASWGPKARRKKPHATDGRTAKEWATAGLTREMALSVFTEHCGKMRERGAARPPWSLSCFEADVQAALTAGAAPPRDKPVRRESDDRAAWRNRLMGFATSSLWMSGWGPKPGEPRCEAPSDLIAEIVTPTCLDVAL